MYKKFILDKLIQSNTNSESNQQSDTSLVFRMKENRWIKPTQTAHLQKWMTSKFNIFIKMY